MAHHEGSTFFGPVSGPAKHHLYGHGAVIEAAKNHPYDHGTVSVRPEITGTAMWQPELQKIITNYNKKYNGYHFCYNLL